MTSKLWHESRSEGIVKEAPLLSLTLQFIFSLLASLLVTGLFQQSHAATTPVQATAEIVSPTVFRSVWMNEQSAEAMITISSSLEEKIKASRNIALLWLEKKDSLSANQLHILMIELRNENPELQISKSDLAQFIARY